MTFSKYAYISDKLYIAILIGIAYVYFTECQDLGYCVKLRDVLATARG
jgi:hypothetical protein